ncbi:STM4011 family radical SAM protein [Bradyrhizobium sp. HKCCYLS2038]|uniref:STM4011 family radical SAM protein n=1 Tax=unclassified Bradyrhizobium TaxID=2631580 RepID=UPI003EBA14FD
MALNLSILYRGHLASCNYGCPYCPFAKRHDSREALARDYAALERFLAWIEARPTDRFKVLFTPWGEALIRKPYRAAMIRLSRLGHVARVAIQTNLSCNLDWVADCDLDRAAFWCTYHPGEIARDSFLDQCRTLERIGARHSVGIVGLREHLDEIEALRAALPPTTYLWVNAYKRVANYYTSEDIARILAVDPLFELNLQVYQSRGRACRAGEEMVTVDGDGAVRRCHFVRDVIGNLYDPGFEQVLQPRACSGDICRCHIGYVHMRDLDLYTLFGDGVLERIPAELPTREAAQQRLAHMTLP